MSSSAKLPRGRPFQKGQSGNPGGRPKVAARLRELARAHTDLALNTLVEVAGDRKVSPAARIAAANALLDRGYGRVGPEIALTETCGGLDVDLEFARRVAFVLQLGAPEGGNFIEGESE